MSAQGRIVSTNQSSSRDNQQQDMKRREKWSEESADQNKKEQVNIEKVVRLVQNKSREDLVTLRTYLQSRLQYFQQLKDNNQSASIDLIIAHSKCLTYSKQEKVYTYGMEPDGFYMIIEGRVSVQSPNLNFMSLHNSALQFEEIIQLSDGSHFGDYEINEKKVRVHQIVCLSQKLYILYLEKKQFLNILSAYEEQKLVSGSKMLKDFELFAEQRLDNLREIFYTVKQKECDKNQYIFREGEKSQGIFLILKGDFCISKDKIIEYPLHSKNIICKTFQIHRLTQGQMFGEEDLYESQSRSYDVQCFSKSGLLWVITLEVFIFILYLKLIL